MKQKYEESNNSDETKTSPLVGFKMGIVKYDGNNTPQSEETKAKPTPACMKKTYNPDDYELA